MADNWKNSKENHTRWSFKNAMVEDLIETPEASKVEALTLKEVSSNCIENCIRQCQRNNIRFSFF